MIHEIDEINNPNIGESIRTTPACFEREKKAKELMEIIQDGISPLTMKAKRDVLCAVRLLLKLK